MLEASLASLRSRRIATVAATAAVFCGAITGLTLTATRAVQADDDVVVEDRPVLRATADPSPTTALGKLLAAKGVTLREDCKELGTYEGMGQSAITITAVSAYDARQPTERIGGFILLFHDHRRYADYDYTAYIDLDEAQNLVTSLNSMADSAGQWKGTHADFDRVARFHGTDYFQFSLTDFGPSSGRDGQQEFSAYAGLVYDTRVTFRGVDHVRDFAHVMQNGVDWLASDR